MSVTGEAGTSGAALELSANGVLDATLVLGDTSVSGIALAMGPALAVSCHRCGWCVSSHYCHV